MSGWRPALAYGALAGRRIFVTGAGSGLGRAIALRLVALGAEVLLVCLRSLAVHGPKN
jgi:NAD(P)-dependent dehydrogenase (short-subunit alcohol dehydrogenase family)